MFNTATPSVEFASAPAWRDIFYGDYGDPKPEDLKRLRVWLRDHPYARLVLYHGTKARNPIMTEGLLPTSPRRRNSIQSRSGRVSLSVYPGHASDFGRLGGNYAEPVALYKVTISVRQAVPDSDQLRNVRMWSRLPVRIGTGQIGTGLAESLAYGHGVQVKGRIEIFQIEQIPDPALSRSQPDL